MFYHNIKHDDQTNGDGLRVTIFVSGCSHHCPECQNPQTWEFNSGIEFADDELQEVMQELDKDYISGVTLSGGDPLFNPNVPNIIGLCEIIKQLYPNKTIWCYTGYSYEEVLNSDFRRPVLNYIDVLVDGEYKKDLRDTQLMWRGSSNQRVIDVKKSLKEGKVVLHCE